MKIKGEYSGKIYEVSDESATQEVIDKISAYENQFKKEGVDSSSQEVAQKPNIAARATQALASAVVNPLPLIKQAGKAVYENPEEVVRYGVPLAAQLATTEFGPAGQSAAGFVSGYGAEFGAQAIEKMKGERESFSNEKALGSAITSAVPFYANMGGGIAGKLAANVLPSIGASELARYIEAPKGEYQFQPETRMEAFQRAVPAVVPAAGVVIGSSIKGYSSLVKKAESVRNDLQREPVLSDLFGKVEGGLLNEIFGASGTERAAYNRGYELAKSNIERATDAPSKILSELVSGRPDTFELTERVRKASEPLDAYYIKLKAAQDESTALLAKANELQSQGSSLATDAFAKSKDAAIKAQAAEHLYGIGVRKMVGKGRLPDADTLAPSARAASLSEFGNDIEKARSTANRVSYGAAGIEGNTPMVSASELYDAASTIKDTRIKEQYISSLEKSGIKLPNAEEGVGDAVLTYTHLQGLKEDFGKALVGDAVHTSASKARATELYKTADEAAGKSYKSRNPSRVEAYDNAKATAKQFFDLDKSKAASVISSGDPDQIIQAIVAPKSASGFYNDLVKHKNNLMKVYKETGDEGIKDIADSLMDKAHHEIKKSVIASASNLTAGAEGMQMIDPAKLVKTLSDLRVSGFPVSVLGMGTVRDIEALSRLQQGAQAGTSFYKKTVSLGDVDRFVNDAAALGLDKAVAKEKYRGALKKAFLETDSGRKLQQAQAARASAKSSKLDQVEVQSIIDDLKKDPLVSFFSEAKSNMNIVNDSAKNSEFMSSVLSLEPIVVNKFMRALEKSDPVKAEVAKQAAIASIFKFEKGSSDINIPATLDFFFNPENLNSRKALESVLQKDGYDAVMKTYALPLKRLSETLERATGKVPSNFNQIRATSAMLGGSDAAYKTKALMAPINFALNRKYWFLSKVLLDKKYSSLLKRTGYNMDKAIQMPQIQLLSKVGQYSGEQEQEKSPQ